MEAVRGKSYLLECLDAPDHLWTEWPRSGGDIDWNNDEELAIKKLNQVADNMPEYEFRLSVRETITLIS